MALCTSAELVEGGDGVPFEVLYFGQLNAAFAIRFEGVAYAYLNRCAHVPMEMDYQPNRFFDASGQWLICATHGAMYSPSSGLCMGGPCRGGLIPVAMSESGGTVYWHSTAHLQPLDNLT